ncbi:sugar ABC transporter substrate-binding protein [Saccharothrix variisporea]|uniref:Xylose-binding protein n=1 Tax=Saccharothrix variisporea TaxID=543527 RepID=A0A495X2R4_9PSEU|nr:substrate-binding domain-containing protein [Saccharothrix variisporea]RKT68177.1 xylose-binding protein [Saccharothrix variisporea]
MRRKFPVRTAATCCLALLLASCGKSAPPAKQAQSPGGQPKVGVILPDTTSSVRWERFDRPWLEKFLHGVGVDARIVNAENDPHRFVSLADEFIAEGVEVLVLTAVDSESAAAVERKAHAAGIPTINYDRLTLGGNADYYVSFDGVAVGTLQAEGLGKCLGAGRATVIELEGAKTDNNSSLFYEGQQRVLKPKYDAGQYKLLGNQWIEGWDNDLAGHVFADLLAANGGKVDGVVAANDGFAGEVIEVLAAKGLAGKVAVTGQDATVEGLRAILRGDQCMTVHKSVRAEAEATAGLVSALAGGGTANADTLVTQFIHDPRTDREIKALLLPPVAITKDNIGLVVEDDSVRLSQLCTEDNAEQCKAAGLS